MFFGRRCSTCFVTDPNILVLLGSNDLHFVATSGEMEGAFLRPPGGGGGCVSPTYFKVSWCQMCFSYCSLEREKL